MARGSEDESLYGKLEDLTKILANEEELQDTKPQLRKRKVSRKRSKIPYDVIKEKVSQVQTLII